MKQGLFLIAALLLSLGAHASEWIDYSNGDGRIAIPVTIDGKDAVAVIDSARRGIVVSSSVVAEDGADRFGVDIAGTQVTVDDARVAPLSSADLLLGRTFFDDHVLQIDFPNQRLRLIDRKSSNIKKTANVKMKDLSGSRLPVVRVNVNREYKPWIVFDIGNTEGLSFTRERAEKRGWLERFETLEGASTPSFYLPELALGPFTHSNVVASVAGYGVDQTRILADGRNTGSRLSGNKVKLPEGRLGYEVLRQYVATIDFKRLLLRLAEPVDDSADAGG